MIRDPEELNIGQTVFLYPQTKTASTSCHRQLSVRVMHDPKKHWPMVVVEWYEDGSQRWELVHRDNIRKKAVAVTSKAEKAQGDSIGDGQARKRGGTNRVRVMPGAKKYEPTEGQETLF